MARTGNHCEMVSWGICGIHKTNVCQLLPCNISTVSAIKHCHQKLPLPKSCYKMTGTLDSMYLQKVTYHQFMKICHFILYCQSFLKTISVQYVIKYLIKQKSLTNNKSQALENKYSDKDQSGSFSNRESNQSSNSNQDY